MARITSVIREDARWILERSGLPLDRLRGRTLLLTGACGFLGAYVLDVLACWNQDQDTPCRILAMDNFLVGLPERIEHLRGRGDIRFLSHDLTRAYVPDEPIHAIFHAAGVASPTFYRRFPLETIDVNVGGTRQLLELCRTQPVEWMLHLSTSEIYGDPTPDAIPTREDYRGLVSCTGPRACYDESKRLSETLCALYRDQYGVPIKVGRPFNVYGPGQRIDDRRIVPDLMQAAVKGEPLVLLSDGRATRSFCYLRDATWAMLLIGLEGAAGEAYNMGNDRDEVSMLQVAETLREVAGLAPPVQYRVSEDAHYLTDNPQRRCPDLAKLRALGPYDPQVQLREGLDRTFRSYREDQR
ncbi:NAD-dependent epimerase/dehydratase family protein [Mesoterricola silvestris]|uniref:dTDP-glucose 4,6-dehydratase n=1 Tax=Mesoterricola silvestris TaxID=2927979 RepID=A0AA48GJQ9_9BACT|nr:NAD-dependent epimerase/dehydratase family protein [Mesoterricola silvestris]BDU71009.1 dTDP-glucose 4,6-dehydratase [Mesoterricola silvestris]